MKKTVLSLVALLAVFTTMAQDITGAWHGLLEIPGSPLRLVLNIEKSDPGYTSTLDSPDQGAKGIPVDTTTFVAARLDIAIAALSLSYTEELVDGRLKGTFTQSGFNLPLEFSREPVEKPIHNKPQEPKEPFPYSSEEVSFKNPGPDIVLAGTLTLPKGSGKYPVVVMISGSGPQDRNEELAGHKPYLVIVDYLTRNGIGVLRFDDRGVGESKGKFRMATSEDFATDVKSAVTFLKTRDDIDKNHIGLIGHSEGGLIAPMVASKNDDVSFIVLMAGTGIPGGELLALQGRLIGKAAGQSDTDVGRSATIRKKMIEMAVASDDSPTLRSDLSEYLKMEVQNDSLDLVPAGVDVDQFIKSKVDFMATPWMVYFLRHDPAKVLELEKVTCPVLAINGGIDLQVPAEVNLSAIGMTLKKAGNTEMTIKELPA